MSLRTFLQPARATDTVDTVDPARVEHERQVRTARASSRGALDGEWDGPFAATRLREAG